MKRIGFALMALALLMGFTQCNKDKVVPETPELEGEKYHITVTLGGSSKDRADVYPDDAQDIAPVYYEIGLDSIIVVYNGSYAGTIKCKSIHDYHPNDPSYPTNYYDASADFEGDITIADKDDLSPLYFYYLGNFAFTVSGSDIIVDISDQRSKLPVISFACSKESFTGSGDYTVYNGHNGQGHHWLLNQCALVKFECENIYDMSNNNNDNNPDAIYKTTKDITIYGMENQVTINMNSTLNSPSFTWNQVNNGAIILHKLPLDPGAQDSVRYAIVHQNDYRSVTAGDLDVPFNPSSDPYGFYGTYKIADSLRKNQYFDGAKIDLVWHSGAYSINSSGDKAVFSRGNLQYKDSSGSFRFAKHQYDWVGGELEHHPGVFQGNVVYDENDNTSTQKSNNVLIGDITYYGWIDLFGYGVTAHNPTYHEKGNHNYIIKLSGSWTGIAGDAVVRFDEWGENNIENSGTPRNTSWWTTLTKDECEYVLEHRANADDKVGFAEITLNDGFGNEKVRGMVVLPDIWDDSWHPTTWKRADWENIIQNPYDLDWPINHYNNVYTTSQWRDMELHGAVFLPCAGYRDQDGTNNAVEFDGGHNTQQNRATYWSKGVQGPDAAWGFAFGYASGNDWIINGNHVQGNCGMTPDNGRSVRLVHKLSSSKLFNFPQKP